MTEGPALQDSAWPESHCWGCGPHNPHGLQIKSRWEGDDCVCVFHPKPEHAAGPRHVVNGGILATVVDCHGIWTGLSAIHRHQGREIGSDPPIWCVTGALRLDYRGPTAIDAPVTLLARPREVEGRKVWIDCQVVSRNEVTVEAELLAVSVPLEWMDPASDGSA